MGVAGFCGSRVPHGSSEASPMEQTPSEPLTAGGEYSGFCDAELLQRLQREHEKAAAAAADSVFELEVQLEQVEQARALDQVAAREEIDKLNLHVAWMTDQMRMLRRQNAEQQASMRLVQELELIIQELEDKLTSAGDQHAESQTIGLTIASSVSGQTAAFGKGSAQCDTDSSAAALTKALHTISELEIELAQAQAQSSAGRHEDTYSAPGGALGTDSSETLKDALGRISELEAPDDFIGAVDEFFATATAAA